MSYNNEKFARIIERKRRKNMSGNDYSNSSFSSMSSVSVSSDFLLRFKRTIPGKANRSGFYLYCNQYHFNSWFCKPWHDCCICNNNKYKLFCRYTSNIQLWLVLNENHEMMNQWVSSNPTLFYYFVYQTLIYPSNILLMSII